MKIWHVIKQYCLYTSRIKIAMIMMVVFPIVLVSILSFAFKGSFSVQSEFSKIKVDYSIQSKDEKFKEAFKKYMDTLQKEVGIEFVESKDADVSKEDVKNRLKTSFIEILDENTVNIYTNNSDELNSSMVKNIIEEYFNKSKVLGSVIKFAPDKINSIKFDSKPDFIQKKGINHNKTASSVDYYSIAMIVQMGLYASVSAIFAIYSQKRLDCLKRIGLSGIGIGKYMTGVILGNIIISGVQLFIIYLFSVLVLGANWGQNRLSIALLYFTLLFFSSSIGVTVGLVVKNEVVASMLPQLIIPFFAFLGGAYMPTTFGTFSYISPIYWSNKAVNILVFGGDMNIVRIAFFVNVAVGLFFYIFALIKGRKVVFA